MAWAEHPFYQGRRCHTLATLLEEPEGERIVEAARGNPFIEYVKEHALLKDDAAALGEVNRIVVEAAQPDLVGRQLVWVVETKETKVRFPLAKRGRAYRKGEGAPVIVAGEHYDYVDVDTDIELQATAEYSRSFLEDASWDVVARLTAEVGRSIARRESEEILSLLTGLSPTSLAGGGEHTGDGTFTYTDVLELARRVWAEDFGKEGLVCVVHPNQAAELLNDDRFTSALYFGEALDKERGWFARDVLGISFLKTTLIADGTVLMVDPKVAVGMALRRDLVTETYENTRDQVYGVVGTTRFGLGVLRSRAVARGTGE
jgi:hypothetical protein